MHWYNLIPTSFAALAGPLLLIAAALVLLDPPGGINWTAIGAWFALIGGFGIVGAAGWLAAKILKGSGTVLTVGDRWISNAVGGGAFLVIFVIVLVWSYKHLTTKGIEAGGNNKWSRRARGLVKAGVFAIAGALLAALIPEFYTFVNWGYGSIAEGIVTAASS